MIFQAKSIASWFIIVLMLLQFVPLPRRNPNERQPLRAPVAVVTVLRNSCYQCHSHETRWEFPLGTVAPFAWWMSQRVEHGRRALNFSTTASLSVYEKERVTVMLRNPKEHQPLYYVLHSNVLPDSVGVATVQLWATHR
uniref:Haem-binding domain-containing protein n=1 Tax=Chlorobium chlorochromatii (strain CaD3) TaxID=340177 RepID=Q3ATV3_CHLCH